jgi:uncharacterized repeat protein (TIGR03803 family)
MKSNGIVFANAVLIGLQTKSVHVCFWTVLFLQLTTAALAAERQVLHGHVPSAGARMAPVDRLSPSNRLDLAIGLPLRNREGLTNLLAQLYDPASANYRHYLTSKEFAQRFAPSEEDYQAVIDFALSRGLTVTGKHPNRTLVDVKGSAADIEKAFHVTLRIYEHPTEPRTFYAPDVEPSIDLSVPVLGISGLNNFMLPHPLIKTIPPNMPKPNLTGSGPSGYFLGKDFRACYAPGVPLTGTGQVVGLVEFDGFYPSDIAAYKTLAGLPDIPVTAVLLPGVNGVPGFANSEVALDIDMAISMAPGLSEVIVYEGGIPNDVLNRMATDNLAKQLSSSWNWYSFDNQGMDQIFQQFAAQGQSFFNASGDNGAYTGPILAPSDDPYITIVGGTDLTTTGAGAWVSETTYPFSGGGISTLYPIPTWQLGISMTANQGSSTFRNIPDVAMIADNVWLIANNGQQFATGGTSVSAPLWAGFTALANQMALENGEPTVGFINPALYALNKGSSYTTLCHDITTGNNETFSSSTLFRATRGYDLCTGWGTPRGSALLTALALPEPLRITPGPDVILITGPIGGPFSPATATFSLTNNNSAVSLDWTLVNTSPWFNVAPSSGTLVPGGPATEVTASLVAAVTNLAAGSYAATVRFTNLTDNFGQGRQFTLAVVTLPMITAQPTNQAVLEGGTATFAVETGSNALLFYQWQDNGTNLSDGRRVFGSTTSALTISNVSSADLGTYSVTISNAAGQATSAGALLTIIPSLPVITMQPTNQTVLPGTAAPFSVAAIGTPPFFYQWQQNGRDLSNGPNFSGATTPILTVSNVSSANAGAYTVSVSNALGSVSSTGAVLSVVSVTAPGVTLASLYSFPGDIFGPHSGLTQAKDGNFYGTTVGGGNYGAGTVFRFTTNGVQTLHSFGATLTDAASPYAGLVQGKDGNLYGTTAAGGRYGDGTVFRITTNGAGVFPLLVSFHGDNGASPVAGLVQGSDGNFYGTTQNGGAYGNGTAFNSGYGTVFTMTPAGLLTTLVSFNYANGAYPSGVLVQGTDGNFYGTTPNGGTNGGGTVFKMTTSGNLSTLYSFGGGNDGSFPGAGLVQVTDGSFYGTTFYGGARGFGTVFRITSSGVLTTLYSFNGGNDGGYPSGGLVQSTDGNLYGTTQTGATYGGGTVFRIAPNGSLATLAAFDVYQGATPQGALVLGTDGNLYGTTQTGGTSGMGAIFQLSFNSPLQITGQPADQVAFIGGNALFSVATLGSLPVSYQWREGGRDLSDSGNLFGSTNRTLVLTNVTPANVGIYSVLVSNASGSVASAGAALGIIYSPPFIVTQPSTQTRLLGTTATFSVDALGDLPLLYQWQQNGTNLTDGGNILGATTSTLIVTNLSPDNGGTYSVIVSNAFESVLSDDAVLVVIPVTPPGASMTNIYQFGEFGDITDGAFPYGGLIQAKSGSLYGTTWGGGSQFNGTVFTITNNGGFYGYGVSHSFSGHFEGGHPYAGLVQATNGSLYGTALTGGAYSSGTIYWLTSSGRFVNSIYSFTGGNDGSNPDAVLTLGADGNLYGTTSYGGAFFSGSAFRASLIGAVTNLYSFMAGNDGAYPYGGLTLGADGSFYGITKGGGPYFYGTAFKMTRGGTLTTLATFDYFNGANPQARVIQSADGRFYGTTYSGGSNGLGTVFQLTTNGLLTTLVSFNGTNGANPAAALVQGTDGSFYGTTTSGGPDGRGSVFRITPQGALTTLIWFDGFHGANPQAPLLQASDGNFYGTTTSGGKGYPTAGGGNGVIFRLTVPLFINNPFAMPAAIAAVAYSNSVSGQTSYPPGDTLTFAKVSGPAWLSVATNGLLSGAPANQDTGTNTFVVSLADSNGFFASATMSIIVNSNQPPSFAGGPLTEPWANVDETYSATIATNATDPDQGDALTFAKVSGPAWLNVASNGVLSGAPESSDAGTNVFVVSATDLDGNSATAPMNLYVNSAPLFTPRQFSKAAAVVGLPYTGTIATNATDPDLSAGDTLAFYKVSGPAWLDVAANGAFSGTPSNADVGANVFLVLVVDSGGLAGMGSMSVTVNTNHPPLFASNPFTAPAAHAGLAYSATIATNAIDSDPGDPLTFAKVSGPNWLSVAGSGALSGIPGNPDAGTNTFLVSVTDLGGLSNAATMYVNVVGPIWLGIVQQDGQISLSWTGGLPPYHVQTATNLTQLQWLNVGGSVSSNSFIFAPSNASAWFRVQGQ